MESIGELIRKLRGEKGEPLRKVAAYLDVDQAVLSKIERGQRKATKEQVEKLAKYFRADKKEMLVAWLSDRILYEVQDEELAKEALKVAEERVHYLTTPKVSMDKVKRMLKKELKKYPMVKKAWLFGSFSRNEQTYKSDIDIMIEVPEEKGFSLFDMFQIQYDLEQGLKRKIDMVLKGSLKPFAWKIAQKDIKLIYERL